MNTSATDQYLPFFSSSWVRSAHHSHRLRRYRISWIYNIKKKKKKEGSEERDRRNTDLTDISGGRSIVGVLPAFGIDPWRGGSSFKTKKKLFLFQEVLVVVGTKQLKQITLAFQIWCCFGLPSINFELFYFCVTAGYFQFDWIVGRCFEIFLRLFQASGRFWWLVSGVSRFLADF